MKMVFVVNMANTYTDVLNELGIKERLISFAYCGDRPEFMNLYAASRSARKKDHDLCKQSMDGGEGPVVAGDDAGTASTVAAELRPEPDTRRVRRRARGGV